jgi:flagellar M-ring protein FliF
LSNVPPGAGTTNPAAAAPAAPGTAPAVPPMNTSKQATRNYELDKTISHTRNPLGSVRRLSVAVVLDNVMVTNDEGDAERKPISAEDLTRYTNLVKEAVGFNEERGDTVNVINAPFQAAPEIEPAPAPPIWEQAWIWEVGRKLGVGVLILMLILGVVRPTMKSLAEKGIEAPRGEMALAGPDGMVGEDRLSLTGQQGQLPPPQNMHYESHLNTARTMVQQDPKRVAQVVKNWVGDDG